MHPLGSLATQRDSGALTVKRDDVIKVVVTGKWCHRSVDPEKNLSMVGDGAAVLKVVDNRNSAAVLTGSRFTSVIRSF